MDILDELMEMLVPIIWQVLGAIIVLIVGLKLINKLTVVLKGKIEHSDIDPSLRTILFSILSIVLKLLLGISVASMLGAEMTSFIAILGAASFAVGLALQGSLANFGGGVLILLFKPFKVGDAIEAQGFVGLVKEIQVFYTVIDTFDKRKVVIPNAQLSNSSVINITAYPTRRLEWKFGVSYSSDILKVKEILTALIAEHPALHDEPEPMVVLSEHADSALVFTVRAWCNASDFWPTFFNVMEQVKLAFDKEGISIPFPQMDVHLNKLD